MRVLWFSITSALYGSQYNQFNGGGWIESLQRSVMAHGEIDLGMKVDSHVFLFYLGMLPVAMMGFNERKNYTNDEIFTIFSAIFDFIEYGVADFSV